MSKMFQVYGIGQALIPVLPPPLPFENPPTSNQTNYEIGQLVFTPPQAPTAFYMYAGGGNWILIASGSGDIISVLGTANQITVTTVAGVATISLPAAIVTPGSLTTTTSLAATTTVTAGTGITSTTGNIVATAGAVSAGTTVTGGTGVTATTGNVTATNGNLVASTAGTGILLNPGTITGTTSATLNARAGQITITTPSIAAGATFAFTLSNTAITGSTTQVMYALTGGTTGAALTIQSYANTANQSVITLQNGTGATTNTASLTLNFIVVN